MDQGQGTRTRIRQSRKDERKRWALIAMPPVLLVTMYYGFPLLAAWFGTKAGYLAGFLVYWLVWCLGTSIWVLGREGIARIFRDVPHRFGSPAWVGVLLLLIPLLLGYGYAFPRALGQATGVVVILSALIALTNGTLEELLWRGAYLQAFGGRGFWGYLYPSLGFAVWHLAPQTVFANSAPGGAWSLVFVAGAVALMWGWVAGRSGSILWVTLSHVLFDFSGLGARIYF